MILTAAFLTIAMTPIQSDRWELDKTGGIRSDLAKLTRGQAHADHLEMGGRSVNSIVKWSVSASGEVMLDRVIRWPMMREAKDDTHAALYRNILSKDDPSLKVNGKPFAGKGEAFQIHGMLSWTEKDNILTVTRTVFPSVSLPCLLEKWEIVNTSKSTVEIEVPTEPKEELLPREWFAWSAHWIRTQWIGGGRRKLAPGEKMVTGMAFSAREEKQPPIYPDIEAEWAGRMAFLARQEQALNLKTGNPAVDRLFAFSKLRAAENVLSTRGGLMHAPGGFNRYLAALWCNDQNEYVSPFFPFLGDEAGNESARNAYKWFAKYMNPDFKPIPSSIVAEGRGIWDGAGDRGDAAMTAYGASRWALATGDKELAREVWPFIEWCLEYCERQKTADGVIASRSDELEGRFSSGKTNLATSSLTYDGLISAAYLAVSLGEPAAKAATYRQRASELRAAIGRVFGAKLKGFDTYRYHEGLEKLRAWICIPLVMDIDDRAEGTAQALFSPDLWTKDGLLTEAGTTTYWDRATLYALRGVFRAGQPDKAAEYLDRYARRRLLGDHVPYCQEAYPEQNQSHLSAESGLFCRIVTEGICGIRPTGFDSFSAKPSLPAAWPSVKLDRIHAFGRVWSYEATRRAKGIELIIRTADGKVCYRATKPAGESHEVEFR